MTIRIMVLGASGLIGHKLYEHLRNRFDVYAVLHGSREAAGARLFQAGDNVIEHVDVRHFDIVQGVVVALRPDVVLNCTGITKRKVDIRNIAASITTNSLFPHRLSSLISTVGGRVLHFSTDCVFDGRNGPYTEDSIPTPVDTYGRTKALGEVVHYPTTLTLRSSFIGRELTGRTELLEWFLAQRGNTIPGYSRVMYSGISTKEMARIVERIVADYPNLAGLYQLAMPNAISKFELLEYARRAYDLDVRIEPDDSIVSMPTLDGSRLAAVLDLELPDWPTMLQELAADSLYDDA